MSHQFIQLDMEFNAPVEEVFSILSNHEQFGKILNTRVKRVKDGQKDINGLGSVRRISPIPLPLPLGEFEETVTGFTPNKLVEYTITRGSPLKNHLGRMLFQGINGKTQLHYTIQFETKLPLPFSGSIIRLGLEQLMTFGLKKVARRYS